MPWDWSCRSSLGGTRPNASIMSHNDADRNEQAVTRHCQPCTACCDGWVRIVIGGVDVYPGHPCPHSAGGGCRIYPDRPVDPCVTFECGWKKGASPLPDWMRPDLAGVLLLPAVREWGGRPVDVAVPVGARIPERALAWLKRHALDARRPLIYLQQADTGGVQSEQEAIAFGPPEFQVETARLLAAGERLW